ncbi:MAG: glycosyltransferase [Chromatiales bacterium]|jgi:glycosyltransferase involved in cell wall biosynthesis|nr:glycosyltransferase [Chromatiales bacterium]
MPRFSVVVPLYNHETYVEEALRSVLAQTDPDLELIVVDDGSTDASAARVRTIDDPRLHYHYQDNAGAHAAINRGVGMARGDYVAILNSDDVYAPGRLEAAGRAFAADPELAAVFTGYDFIDAGSAVVRHAEDVARDFPEPAMVMGEHFARLDAREQMLLRLLGRNFLHTTSNLICRREVFAQVGPFAPWRYVHDHDFFLRLAHRYPIRFDPAPLLHYRFHGSNTLAEDGARSVLETMRMLGGFLLTHPLAAFGRDDEVGRAALRYVYRDLRLYDGDRVLLAILLAAANRQAVHGTMPPPPSGLPDGLLADDADALAFIAERIERSAECERCERDLAWQKEQTDRWWSETQELEMRLHRHEADLAWQKEQTDRWWSEARTWQEHHAALDRQIAELRRMHDDTCRQRDEWHRLYETSRHCGIPHAMRAIGRRIARLTKRSRDAS